MIGMIAFAAHLLCILLHLFDFYFINAEVNNEKIIVKLPINIELSIFYIFVLVNH